VDCLVFIRAFMPAPESAAAKVLFFMFQKDERHVRGH
jgi:hypothetical protein